MPAVSFITATSSSLERTEQLNLLTRNTTLSHKVIIATAFKTLYLFGPDIETFYRVGSHHSPGIPSIAVDLQKPHRPF